MARKTRVYAFGIENSTHKHVISSETAKGQANSIPSKVTPPPPIIKRPKKT